MTDTRDLQEIEKEARGAFNEDGLLYVFIGLLLFFAGASFVYRPLLIFVALGSLLIYPLEALRRRLTYPRLGYAKFSAPPGTLRGILIFALITIFILAAIALFDNGRFQRILPLAFSAVFALSLYFGLSMQGLHAADVLLILATLLLGLIASWLYPDWRQGTAVSFTLTGLLFITFGLIKLFLFLCNVPLLDQSSDR